MDRNESEKLRVKRSITDAFFALLRKQDIESISVSELTQAANVSRMSYYRHFDTKRDIIYFYMDDVLETMTASLKHDFNFWSIEYGKAFLQTMQMHRERILLLDKLGLSGIVLNKFNVANEEFAGDMPRHSIERFKLYYAAGASYNGMIEWLKDGCKESVEGMAQSIWGFMNVDS